MAGSVNFLLSGIDSIAVSQRALACGVDALGVEVSPSSPRCVDLAARTELLHALPDHVEKVAVVRNPGFGDLEGVSGPEFDSVLVYFPNETPFFEVAMWTDVVAPEKLLLAPQVLPRGTMDAAFFPLADRLVFDGSGKPAEGDQPMESGWAEFARLQMAYRKVSWVLDGRLFVDDPQPALEKSQTQRVLISANLIETSPGVIDGEKLSALMAGAEAAETVG